MKILSDPNCRLLFQSGLKTTLAKGSKNTNRGLGKNLSNSPTVSHVTYCCYLLMYSFICSCCAQDEWTILRERVWLMFYCWKHLVVLCLAHLLWLTGAIAKVGNETHVIKMIQWHNTWKINDPAAAGNESTASGLASCSVIITMIKPGGLYRGTYWLCALSIQPLSLACIQIIIVHHGEAVFLCIS